MAVCKSVAVSMSRMRSVIYGVPQGPGPQLFIVFFNDIKSEITCVLSRHMDYTKIKCSEYTGGMTWRDLDRLEKWVNSFIVEQGQVKGPAHRLRQSPVSGQPGK